MVLTEGVSNQHSLFAFKFTKISLLRLEYKNRAQRLTRTSPHGSKLQISGCMHLVDRSNEVHAHTPSVCVRLIVSWGWSLEYKPIRLLEISTPTVDYECMLWVSVDYCHAKTLLHDDAYSFTAPVSCWKLYALQSSSLSPLGSNRSRSKSVGRIRKGISSNCNLLQFPELIHPLYIPHRHGIHCVICLWFVTPACWSYQPMSPIYGCAVSLSNEKAAQIAKKISWKGDL